MSQRVRYRFNRHLQWFHPPLSSSSSGPLVPAPRSLAFDPEHGEMVGLDPDTWALELELLLDRLRSSHVGGVVIGSVRRRTTIYASRGGVQTDVDPFEGEAGVEIPNERIEAAHRDAATSGANALMWIDINGPTQRIDGGVTWDPGATLLHELVHAVNITWGNYQRSVLFTTSEARRFGVGSHEEEMAWIIDNMHRSETGRWLRRQYDGVAMLSPGTIPRSGDTDTELTTSEGRVVSRCRSRVPILAARLEVLDRQACPYNPFRAYARRSPVERPR